MIRSVDFQLFPVSYPDGRFDMHTRANNCINVTKTTRLWPSSRDDAIHSSVFIVRAGTKVLPNLTVD